MFEEKESFKVRHVTRGATVLAFAGRVLGYGSALAAVYFFAVQKPFHSLGLIALGAFAMAGAQAAANMMDEAAKKKEKE